MIIAEIIAGNVHIFGNGKYLIDYCYNTGNYSDRIKLIRTCILYSFCLTTVEI